MDAVCLQGCLFFKNLRMAAKKLRVKCRELVLAEFMQNRLLSQVQLIRNYMRSPTALMSSSCFPTTQWTQVIAVLQQEDEEESWRALGEFCKLYRPAVYNFFRRHGYSRERAEDYTQDFFAERILRPWGEGEGMLHRARSDENRRFRSFLSHVLWRFLQDKWKHERARSVGGSTPHVPLNGVERDGEMAGLQTFEQFGRDFDLVFALEILRKAAQRSRHSNYLESHLRGEISQREAARALGISENAFKAAFCRFRQRLAFDLWDEVAKLSGPDENEIRAELEYLMSLFAIPSA
jgi:DNA-directed RNA polymerase specialized sigma24 family protein